MGMFGRIALVVGGVAAVALELVALTAWQDGADQRAAARAVMTPAVAQAIAQIEPDRVVAPALLVRPEDGYYQELRTQIHWVSTRLGGADMLTPDPDSRMLLAKSAARRAGLDEVGLSYKDVYGIINAETSWVPRMGAGKDGTPSFGIAQFEPATARALGLRDPDDLVEAVHVAARHMKEAALWSAARIARLHLGVIQRAEKLREGVSIYYNLSSRGRAVWNGRNTMRLPVETRLHIQNARIGAQQAALLDSQLRG